jgi:hypothetical protein
MLMRLMLVRLLLRRRMLMGRYEPACCQQHADDRQGGGRGLTPSRPASS